nr:hypothetical protein [Tanacetum cinerariifolium]
MTDYALWKVIVNGDSPTPKRTVDGVEQTYPPTTVEEKLARKNKLKARGTLLMALPNEHQLKFNSYKNAKLLMEVIEKRFRDSYPDLEEQPDLETLRMDDLYKNLNIYEAEVKGSSSSSQNSQYIAFVFANSSGSTNQAHGSNFGNTDSLSDAVIYYLFVNQSNSLQIDNKDLQQIDADDLEEMDLKWQMAMLTMRARRFLKKTKRKVGAKGSESIRFDQTKVECYNCYRRGHFARECMAPRENRNKEPVRRNVLVETIDASALVAQDGFRYDWRAYKAGLESVEARLDVFKKKEAVFEENIKILKLDIMFRDNALTELRKKFEKAKKERDDLKLTLEKFENSSKNLSKLLDIQVKGIMQFPPLYTGNFMPPKPDLVLVDVDEYVVSKFVTSVPAVGTSEAKTSESKPKSVSEPLIEEWISNSEDDNETESKSKQRKPSFPKVEFVKPTEQVKTLRESVKQEENHKQAKHPRKNSQSPRVQVVSAVQIVKSVSIKVSAVIPQVVSTAKLPILNPNEFDLWKMRIEHYLLMTDYSLWKVILNGDSPAPTRVIEDVVQPVAPTTAE